MKPLYIILLITSIVTNAGIAQTSSLTPEKRESFIQQALQLRKEENYLGAVKKLDSILMYNQTDAPIYLFKGDLLLQAKKFGDAINTYQEVIKLRYETTIATINLSYALFMNHKPVMALRYAQKAWEGDKKNNSAVINYFNAMLWNVKTKEAGTFLAEQDSLLSPAETLVLRARLYTTSGNYQDGLKYYDSLTKTYPQKYYIQEYAEVLLGKKEIEASATVMSRSKTFFTTNEYAAYQKKLQSTQQQNAGTEMSYFSDVAKNTRIENSIWWQQTEGRTYRLRLSAGHATYSSISNDRTNANFANAHVTERWNKAWSGETSVHFQEINTSNNQRIIGLTGQQVVRYQPNDRKMIGASWSSEILNYTTDLLSKNIRSNQLGYITHLMMSGKTGFYSQGSIGFLSDRNRRVQFFGSIYHLFRTSPTIKTGINFSALSFSNPAVKDYFAPGRYLNTEIFAEYSATLPGLPNFSIQIQAASGLQQIEKQNWDPASRMQSSLMYKSKQIDASIQYQTSNVSSNTGTGYRFNKIGASFFWKW